MYEAQHTGTGRRVAVKVISTGDIAKNQALVGRFHREAKAAGSIDTQHIVQVLDTGTDESTGLPFMAMEYLAGEDAQHVFQRLGPVRPELALRIIAQACIGLQKAHEARVVHRDIKPANLFLAERDEGEVLVKILDFGIAKIKLDQQETAETQGLTRTGSMLGSPLYMSPEQARGAKTIDHRADIWSLGVVMYQALAGRTPHHHIEALGELIIAICSELPTPVQDHAPWVPPEVAAVVHGALRFDPAERYQTAADMLAAIKPLLPNGWALRTDMLTPLSDEEKAVVAPKITIGPMAGRASIPVIGGGDTAGTHDPVVGAPASTTPARPPRLGIAAGVALLAGVAGVATYALRSHPPPAPPVAAVTAATPPPPDPEPTAAPTVAPEAPRTVKLVILPEDATVEVDGAAVKAKNGIVDVTGDLGSVHHVHLAKDGADTTEDVVVTVAGALPAKVELELPKKAGPLVPTHVKAGATVAPAAPRPPSAPGITTKFE